MDTLRADVNERHERKAHTYAKRSHVTRCIAEDTMVLDAATGEPVLAYVAGWDVPSGLRARLLGISFRRHARFSGMPSQDRTFGYFPRNKRNQDYCTIGSLSHRNAHANAALFDLAKCASETFARIVPDRFAAQRHRIEREVPEQWRISGSVYTTGIVNLNNRLTYHRDRGNFTDYWSCMLTLRSGCSGGELVLPSLGLALACSDASLCIFDASATLHGVAPFVLDSDGYRITTVMFSMRDLAHALTPDGEVARVGASRLETERRRLLPPGELLAVIKPHKYGSKARKL